MLLKILLFSLSFALADDFEPEGRLKKNVAFWIDVYSKYHTRQGIIHDTKYVDHVYEQIEDPAKSRDFKKKWRSVLLSLHQKSLSGPIDPGTLTPDEKKVFTLFEDIDEPNKYLNASHRKRLRFQVGMREHFLDALKASGRYLPLMEEVFLRDGLPIELTRLPFVESSFNLVIQSKVGASGVWQFMPATGRLYLRVDAAVDERNDPVRATEAAAKLLKSNFDSLGTWPLAVTAYNHGRKNLMRAVRRAGSTDLNVLLSEYRARNFGFASSNYFAELLAAVHVHKNYKRYFGDVDLKAPENFIEATMPDHVVLPQLAKFMKLDLDRIKELNPGVDRTVFQGKLLLPKGYRLRLPDPGNGLEKESAVRVFMAGYDEIPKIFKQAEAAENPRYRRKRRSGKRRAN